MSTTVPVSALAEQVRGVTYGRDDASPSPLPGYLPVLRAGNITEDGLTFDDLVFVPSERISQKQRVRQNDVVIAASSGSLDVVGKAARALTDYEGGFGAFCKVLRPGPDVDPAYFAHFFRTQHYRQKVSALAAGVNINNLRNEHLDQLQIPLPPRPEQRRIAQILDKVDTLRVKRRAALAQLDALAHSIFLDMFGDPATNPKRWPCVTIESLAIKFSDGPFGSNLKSEHYADDGVRVVRLQNIGVGRFIDADRAFISNEHFEVLRKHECLPGDVLVGTLGDPNLRACIQPDWLPKALNKADCILLRPDLSVAHPQYVCALLNCPSTLDMAQGLILGQTRSRISMGRLRGLIVPNPPVELQHEFARRIGAVDNARQMLIRSAATLDELSDSLKTRAFQGTL
jgi:type I restriction enzyme, S subunit